MEKISLTAQIIRRVLYLRDHPLPQEVYHAAERCLLDYCGTVLAGAEASAEKTAGYLDQICASGTNGETTVFGTGRKADIYTAALINGINAHFIELDDGHRFGMMHMAAPVFSALFAVAENKDYSGEQLLRAAVCAYDVAIALARHMQPGHKLKGYHATGTCCTVGAAAGIALLTGQNEAQIQGTLSAAATSAAGLLEVIDDASELKPYNIGRAAMDAAAAAVTGAAGFRGPDDIIGGKRGFFAALAAPEDLPAIKECTLFADDRFAITEIYTKPYAACRHCHPPIEGALKVREQMLAAQVTPAADLIEKITVYTYKLAIAGHDHTEIRSVSSAKMSTPYASAAALLYGKSGMNAYSEEMIGDADTALLTKRTAVVLSDELNKLTPEKRAAIYEVTLKDGRVFSSRVDYPLGEPENPMSDKILEEKCSELAALGGKDPDEISSIIEIVWNFTERSGELFGKLK